MAENKPAHKILRVLILDDSPDDAEQASAALRQAGYMLKTQRFETGVAVEQNLEKNQWDLVLCAHGVSSLPARQVVEQAARKQPLLPVLVLARRISDEELGDLMHAGARDVLIKGQWGRLVPVVERELAVSNERRELAEAREALRQLETRHRSMNEASIEAIGYVQDGMHMDANPSYLRLFGYDQIELLKEIPLLNMIDKQDQARFKQALKKPEGADHTQEFMAVTADGRRIPIEVAMTPLTINGEPCIQLMATDVSKRKALEVKLQSMHQRDSLTGLFNRTHFLDALAKALKSPGGILIALHVNHLSELNKTYGHAACDRMLVQLGLQLRELVGNLCTLARVSGGQFALLLDCNTADRAGALKVKLGELLGGLGIGEGAKTVRPDTTVRELKLDGTIKERHVVMETMFVVSEAQAAAPPPAAVPTAAAAPAVPAKRETSIAAVTPVAAAAPVQGQSGLKDVIAHALSQGGLELRFQPIINLHGEPRCFYEAQLLLRQPNGDILLPTQYLPAAEASGLGNKIDRTLMMNVIDTLSKYQLEGRQGIVFVNLSSLALQDGALLAAIQMHIKATGLDAANIILQLHESAIAAHLPEARSFIQKANAMGVRVAVNQFTGQALGAETLADLNLEYVAVDCGPEGPEEDVLFTALDTAHSLERPTIARRIEDADLFTTLFARGVHYVQGDYLQAASAGLDYSFEAEQTLASDEPLGPSWRAAG